ncbi:MAG: hypothetical protein JO172_05155 [Hyphomicrobiales bacterium]|nr:hypothetical protein [Hyphomicrobiales bacterium]
MAGKIAAKNKTGGEMGATDAPAAEPEVNEARSSRLPRKRPALKVRHEPPTLDDAIYAAQGLTADIEQQIEFAADLMAMPATDLRPLLLKAVAKPSTSNRVFVPARSGMQRAVVIETTGRPRTRRPSSGAVSIP